MKTHSLLPVLLRVALAVCILLAGCSPSASPCTGDAPVADAGRDRDVAVGDIVQLSGEGSFDPDGDTASLTYEWQQTAGPELPVATMTGRDFTFTPPIAGTYIFGLTVRDANRCSGSTTVTISASEVVEVVSQAGGNWSDDIWGLNGAFPDNNVDQSFSVTINEGQDIALDTDVELTALSLAPTSQLAVANKDQGNLTVVGQLASEGALVAGGGRLIHVDGPLDILAGGSYGSPDAQGDDTSALLEAASITIHEGSTAGRMELRGNMQVTTADDLILDGVHRMPFCTPPVFRSTGSARVRVRKDFRINKSATIDVVSSERMLLGGSFLNDSNDPATFDWASSGLSFFAEAGSSTHSFEVAGQDLGASLGFSGNFTMGAVEVGPGCNVTFEDRNDNDEMGQEPCTEALYVHDLIIQPESVLTLDSVRIYCNAVEGDIEQVMTLGCGELVINDECGRADALQSHSMVTGSIETVVAADNYTFCGAAGQRVFIQVNRLSGGLDPQISLFPPDNGDREALAQSDSGITALFDHVLLQSGEYSIRLRDWGGDETGDYILSLVLLPGPLIGPTDPDGGVISFGDTVTGAIDTVVDSDLFAFRGQAGQRVFIQVNRVSGGLDPQIHLFPPNNGDREAVAQSDSGITALFDHVLLESGEYTIRLRDWGGNETGEYILSLETLP